MGIGKWQEKDKNNISLLLSAEIKEICYNKVLELEWLLVPQEAQTYQMHYRLVSPACYEQTKSSAFWNITSVVYLAYPIVIQAISHFLLYSLNSMPFGNKGLL